MQKSKSGETLVQMSRILLLLVGIEVILTAGLLLINIRVTAANIIISLIVTIFLYWKYSMQKAKHKVIYLIVAGTYIATVVLLNAGIYEIAYDGNLYHKFAIGILKMGYNPIYDRVGSYLVALNIPEGQWYGTDIWVECYPKASWYFDAGIYAVTGWSDSAKAFNLIILLSCIGNCYDYFRVKLTVKKALLITIILSITPTSLSMLFSFYLDGSLGQLLLMSIIFLMSITDKDYTGNKCLQFLLLNICIIICGNLKVSGLLFEAVFCFVFFVLWVIRLLKQKEKGFNRKIIRLILYYVITVCETVLLVGAGTYITNIIRYGNVLYPLSAMDGFDIANNLEAVGLHDTNPLVQMLCMIFVKTNYDVYPYLEWKLPFTFDFNQLKRSVYDVVRGGTGVLYSGIIILWLIMVVVLISKKVKKSEDNIMVCIVILTSIFLLCVVPAGGQTRYSPYVFYPVSFTLYSWMLHIKKENFRNKRAELFLTLMVVLIFFNTLPFANFILRGLLETPKIHTAYTEIFEAGNNIYINTHLPGNVFNLIDREINYVYGTADDIMDKNIKYLYLDYGIKE